MNRPYLPFLLFFAVAAVAPRPAPAQSSSQRFTADRVSVVVVFGGAPFPDQGADVLAWIKRSIGVVSDYYAGFPAHDLRVQVNSGEGAGVRHGTSFAAQGALIRLGVGRDVTDAQLHEDWILVHEMIHLALPDVGEEHAWLSEGLATYVEGVARAQAGDRTPIDVWSEDVRQMPRGLPEPGDQGLDHTHTWGRTYWGGALFCLLADIDIRKQTGNRIGLEKALRAISRESGGLASDWQISRVLAVGDSAVGLHVLEQQYAQWKDTPVAVDLPALWQNLGIEVTGDTVQLRSDAPLAAIREAILKPH